EGAGHSERALKASRGAAVSPDVRLYIFLPLGISQQAAGDAEGARATFIEAARLARDLGDTYSLADALAAASVDETGTVDWALLDFLEEAIGLVGSHDSRQRSILLAQLTRSIYFRDAARRHAFSEEAVAIARRLDDSATLLAALRARQYALWEPGQAARRRE